MDVSTEQDYANICYTSGTTADPKGIILSHRNYTANIEQSLSLFLIPMYWTTLLDLALGPCFCPYLRNLYADVVRCKPGFSAGGRNTNGNPEKYSR